MHPFFTWTPLEHKHKTFEHTTQFMRQAAAMYLPKWHHSSNPSLKNISHHCALDTTDTILLDTPAVDGGKTATQLFVGRHKKFVLVHPMKGTDEHSILGSF